VALFVDRAALARPTMRVGPDELAAITTVCARLDGIPLAIELAAARCRSMTPSQIAERLGDHFELLTGGSRRALPRHRALEASVEWSYNLLSDDERAMLCRLSVFAGGFTLAAAEAVGVDSSIDTWAVVDRLTGLVDKSLVLQSDDGRYGLLETVRQFAETRLAGAGDAEQARRRHAAYFAQVTASAEAGLYGPEHLSTRRALQLEIDNLRSALDWAEAAGQIDLALSLMLPIDLFWQRQLAESTDRLNRLLAAPSAAPAWRLLGFAAAAEMACVRGDAPDLVSRVEQGLSLLDETADPVVRGWLQELSGWGRFFCGQHGAEENARAGVELLRSCESPRARYYMLDGLWAVGLSAIGKGRCSEGLAAFAEAATEADLTGAPFGIGRSSVMFGHMQATFGRFGPARQLSSTGRRLLVECDDELRNFGIGGQALADGLTGWDPDAVAWLRTTLEEARRDHHWFALAWGEWALALLETKGYGSGDWRQPVAEAETFMRAVTFGWGAAWAKALAAENLVVEGDPAAARIACEEALAEVEAHTYAEFGRGPVELALAQVDRAQGDLVTAEDTAHRALATLTAAGLALQQVEAIELLAALAAQQGSPAEAVRLFAAASTARAELTFPVPPAEVARRAADLEPARRALSAEELTAAESEGRAMSLGEATTYASRGRGPRKRPTAGWHSLTPTEAEVVALVAEGLTNPAIAAKLFVSRETVKSHLSNSLAKLGVSNRTELATLVARRS
jgi:DNA-binding CsgD family transcriptional regulator